MKAIFRTLFLAALAAFCCAGAYAQDSYYRPTDKWPYIYEEFTEGTVNLTLNQYYEGQLNICIDNGTIHYIDENGVIMESIMGDVVSAVIGAKKYVNVNGKMMEVLFENENGYVVKARSVSQAAQGVDIGFGIVSDTVAAQGVDMATTIGFGGTFIHSRIAEVQREREYGTPLNVDEQYYLKTVSGLCIKATKNDFTDFLGKEKASAFLKSAKVKWNSPSTLLQVVDFLKTEME